MLSDLLSSDLIWSSGVTRLQWARVQVFQKGPLFPTQGAMATSLEESEKLDLIEKIHTNTFHFGKFWAPHSAGPACTARLARPIVTPLIWSEAIFTLQCAPPIRTKYVTQSCLIGHSHGELGLFTAQSLTFSLEEHIKRAQLKWYERFSTQDW